MTTIHGFSPLTSSAPIAGENFTRDDLKEFVQASKPNIALLLVEENGALKQLGDGMMKAILAHLKRENQAISRELEQQLTHLTAQADAARQQETWHFLSTIATSVLSLFSIVAGVQMMGTAAGVYLVGSGTMALANTLITHCNGWNWVAETLASENEDAKAKIRLLLPLTMTLMTLALGVTGARFAGETAKTMIKNLAKLRGYTAAGVFAGQAYNSLHQGRIDAQVLETDKLLKGHDKKVYTLSQELKRLLSENKEIASLTKQAVKQTIRVTTAAAAGA